MIALSALSRTTSISNSFQPSTDSSMRTSLTGDLLNPFLTISSNSIRLKAMPPPSPPRVKDGRIIAGKPIASRDSSACSKLLTTCERGLSRPILSIALRKSSLSSAFSMALIVAPISSTPCLARKPLRARLSAVLSAVCPPMVGSKASGFSSAMILLTISGVIGSI